MPHLTRPAPLWPENVPDALRQYPLWVCWRYPDKAPLSPITGQLVSVRDAGACAPFSDAVLGRELLELGGVGLVQTPDTPFVILDLDGTGRVDAVPDWLGLSPTYAERSPSGEGLRLVYLLPDPHSGARRPRDFNNRGAGVECYAGSGARYLTITGDRLPGVPEEPRALTAADLYRLEKLRPVITGTRGEHAPAVPALDALPRVTRQRWEEVRGRLVDGRPDMQVFIDTGEVADGSSLALGLTIKAIGCGVTPLEALALWLCPGLEQARAHLFRRSGARAGRQTLEAQAAWLWQQVVTRAAAVVEADNPRVLPVDVFGAAPVDADERGEESPMPGPADERGEESPMPGPAEVPISDIIAGITDLDSPEASHVVDWIARQPVLRREKYLGMLANAAGGRCMGALRKAVAAAESALGRDGSAADVSAEMSASALGQLKSYVYVTVQDALYDLRTHVFCPLMGVATAIKCSTDQLRKLIGPVIPIADQLGYVPGAAPITEDYKPGYGTPVRVANTWSRSKYDPWPEPVAAADVAPWLALFDRMNIVEDHIDPEIPGEDHHRVAVGKALLDWMAFVVQYPEEKINWGVLFGGLPGAGKDSLFKPLAAVFGDNYYAIGQTEAQSEFSDFLSSAKLISITEICPGGRKGGKDNLLLYNRLKVWIAADATGRLQVNPKGVTPYTIQNRLAVVAFTNYSHPLTLDPGDRRFMCVWTDIAQSAPRKTAYQQALTQYHTWLDEAHGVEKVYRYLLDRDLSDFNPMGWPPMTSWKQEILAHSAHLQGSDVADMLPTSVLARDYLTTDYVARVLKAGGALRADNRTVATALRDHGYEQCRARGRRVWVRETLLAKNAWTPAQAVAAWLRSGQDMDS